MSSERMTDAEWEADYREKVQRELLEEMDDPSCPRHPWLLQRRCLICRPADSQEKRDGS